MFHNRCTTSVVLWCHNEWVTFQDMRMSVSSNMTHVFLKVQENKVLWSVLGVHWKNWCWSWNSNTLATWCEELTHLRRPWCWERLRAGGEGDNRGWDGWMTSPTQWKWVWVDSGSWLGAGRLGVLWFMGSQRVRHNWATELNWM